MALVLKEIKEKGLENVVSTHHLIRRYHQKFPNLVCLHYSQSNSTLEHPIVKECRGIIIDMSNFAIISFPFTKFFNWNEEAAQETSKNILKTLKEEGKNAVKIHEKLDGSLATLYHYNNEWHVSSSAVPDASSTLTSGDHNNTNNNNSNQQNSQLTFASLFWEVWKELKMEFPEETDHCFMFELLSTKHSIVVRHLKNDLVLVGARNLKSLEEQNTEKFVAKYKSWKLPKLINIDTSNEWNSFEELLNFNDFQSDPTKFEGFVVCDRHWNRVKLKSSQYVALSHLRLEKSMSQNSSLQLLQIVIANEGSEFLSYFPNFKQQYQDLHERFQSLLKFVAIAFKKDLLKITNEKKANDIIRDISTHPLLRQLLLNVWKQAQIENEKQQTIMKLEEDDLIKFVRKQTTLASNFSIQQILTLMNAAEKAIKQNNKLEMLDESIEKSNIPTSKQSKVKEKKKKSTNENQNLFDLLQSSDM